MTRVKLGRAALLSIVLLVVGAAPASAASLLAAAKPWHWWIAPVLTASFLGIVVLLGVGYLVRVVAAKYGIRIGHRTSG